MKTRLPLQVSRKPILVAPGMLKNALKGHRIGQKTQENRVTYAKDKNKFIKVNIFDNPLINPN